MDSHRIFRCLAYLLSLLLLCAVSQFRVSYGHSFLLQPQGDFKSFNKPECRIGGPPHAPDDHCTGPCIAKESWQYDPSHRPVTYARNQTVSVIWGRNNHRGGFVRFTLVPEAHRMNRSMHTQLAFRYACFDSDEVECNLPECGTDEGGKMYRTELRIPSVFPDGRYVLGWSWYGGVYYTGRSFFGDYWSCVSVDIRGGPMQRTFRPVFQPGENIPYLAGHRGPGRCYAAVNKLGVCTREPCNGHKARFLRPAGFSNGRQPAELRAAELRTLMEAQPSPSPLPTRTPGPTARQLAVRQIASAMGELRRVGQPTVTPTPTVRRRAVLDTIQRALNALQVEDHAVLPETAEVTGEEGAAEGVSAEAFELAALLRRLRALRAERVG